MKSNRLFLIIVIFILGFTLCSCSYYMPTTRIEYSPPLVDSNEIILPVISVVSGDVAVMYEKSGVIKPSITSGETVKCEINGNIEELLFKKGDYIYEGDLFAIVNTEKILDKIFIQEIYVEKAEIAYEKAKEEYDTNIADIYTLEFARLNLLSANNYLSDLREDYEEHFIYAPIEGIVVEIFKNIGDQSSGEVVRLCPKDGIIAEFFVQDPGERPWPDNDYQFVFTLKVDTPITVIYDGDEYDGKVLLDTKEYNLNSDNISEDMYGEIKILDNEVNLIPDEEVTLRYFAEISNDVLVLPYSCIYYEISGGAYVYVVIDNEFEKREIELGITDGIFFEVINGLEENEQVLKNN